MQTVLFDRVHGYWSCLASSRLKPHELEPARSDRLVKGNVSPFAALVAAKRLSDLEHQRSAAHEQFMANMDDEGNDQNAESPKTSGTVGRRAVMPIGEALELSTVPGDANAELQVRTHTPHAHRIPEPCEELLKHCTIIQGTCHNLTSLRTQSDSTASGVGTGDRDTKNTRTMYTSCRNLLELQ